jgi:Cu/Zn superoxide dismutase
MRIALVTPFFVAAVLAGCSSSRLPNDPRQFPEIAPEPGAAQDVGRGIGYIARLRPMNGSAAAGSVSVGDRGGVMVIQLALNNVPPGYYAWALHASGNCSSRNGFSAGAAWAPSGAKKPPVELLPEFLVNTESTATVTVRVRDVRIDGDGGINGRSVLIYQGGDIKPLKAEVPNNVVACGVFEPARSLLL